MKTRDERLNKIKQRYPNQFSDRSQIACPPGWITLFQNTCAAIKTVMDSYPSGAIDFKWVQVKEKFAELRLYNQFKFSDSIDTETKDYITAFFNSIVQSAEGASSSICQYCGVSEVHKYSRNGWISTVCGDCEKLTNDEIRDKFYYPKGDE